jgi:murein DD-endopeptidase MepM/ murein hydrolase activator NlpD
MKRGKGIIALVAATAGLGVAAIPATAELHRVTVVLVNGQRVQTTVDVPPGTPVTSVAIPGIVGPIKTVIDNGPVSVPTPSATPPVPVPTLPAPSTPTPDGNGAPGAPNRTEGGAKDSGDQGGTGSTGSVRHTGNRTTRAGTIKGKGKQGKQLIGDLQKAARKKASKKHKGRTTDGAPTITNPTFSLATPGAAPIGVPNFFIDKFRIPPFLLPIYQAAGIQYGVRWEVLAAINEIETDYGRNLNVSSAGALGWMQFMPGTWKLYGVDANKDGVRDPYSPVDAIFATARYLKAAGAEKDLRKAIFAYNHADWYVDSVLMRARLIGGLPANFVGSLTGLTQGHFPVAAKATYADDLTEADAKRLSKRSRKKGNRALVVEGSKRRRGIKIFSRRGAPVIAVNDGKIVRVGHSKRLGRFVQLQDVYGNTYTYARLAKVAKNYPAPRYKTTTPKAVAREMKLPPKDATPSQPASATTVRASKREKSHARAKAAHRHAHRHAARKAARARNAARHVAATKERLFAHPQRRNAGRAGGEQQVFERTGKIDGGSTFKAYFTKVFGLDRKDVRIKKLRPGSRIVAGTVLGRIGKVSVTEAPHMLFEIRPAGRGAPRIDPKPILDGWKLLESTAIYRAAGKNPFFGPDAATPSIGQILMMSKEALVQHVLANPRIEVYSCGRSDIRTGQIDRRVLATLEFLSASGFRPTVTALECGHSYLTTSGNVSEHSSGNAVDIAKVNGIPIVGNQGKGSITELTIRRLLTLQGTMKPDQIISLMTFAGTDNTLALPDHYDHIHVGWKPLYGTNSKAAKQVNSVLKPKQWIKLIDRLGQIDNPEVSLQPSSHALKVTKRASKAHVGE